jgi:LysM repeat protein
MINRQRGTQAALLFTAISLLLTACEVSLSTPPASTPTLIPTGLFVSPFPSVENPMAMIEEFARQTAAAQTAAAGGATGTPLTPQTVTTGTGMVVVTGSSSTPTPISGTPTNANIVATTAVAVSTTVTPGGPTATPIPPGVRPSTYTLQSGEFPYCIARRFNVDPDDLLSMNGLSSGVLYLPGTTLKIPQSGTFPGTRALAAHPTTYSVLSSDETIYSVACKYGDVDPAVLASTNGLSVSADLTAGQSLKIP